MRLGRYLYLVLAVLCFIGAVLSTSQLIQVGSKAEAAVETRFVYTFIEKTTSPTGYVITRSYVQDTQSNKCFLEVIYSGSVSTLQTDPSLCR